MTPKKRGREVTAPDVSSMNVPDIVIRSQWLGGRDATLATIQEIIRVAGTTYDEVQKFGQLEQPFCGATWNIVAPKLNLKVELGINQFEDFSVPSAILPRSFLKKVLFSANGWLDVYCELPAYERGASRVRILEPWIVPVCELFKGRLFDKPESSMPPTEAASGGEVEHEIAMLEGTLLLLVELKLYYKNLNDHIAHVMLELLSAYQKNRDRNLHPQPPVYAILTNLEVFYFFRYDGSKFSCTEISVKSRTREAFLLGMCEVTERLFSILLNSYIEVLTAVESHSKQLEQARIDDLLIRACPSIFLTSTPSTKRQKKKKKTEEPTLPSTDRWSQALAKAHATQSALANVDRKQADWEEHAENGLELLFESVRFLDKFGSMEDWDDQCLETKVDQVLSKYCASSFVED